VTEKIEKEEGKNVRRFSSQESGLSTKKNSQSYTLPTERMVLVSGGKNASSRRRRGGGSQATSCTHADTLDAAMRLEFGRKWPRAKLLVAGAGLGEVLV
jgi:hypothetical protein